MVALTAFIVRERSAREPLLPLGMFAVKNFSWAPLMIFAAGVAMFGATLYLPLYQQTVQHASATSSGLLLLPMMLPIPITSTIAGRVMSKTGRYKVFAIIGATCLTVGLALLATMGVNTSRVTTSVYMVVAGTGLGFLMQMPNTIAQKSVDLRNMGAASAGMSLFRTLGGSIGVATFGSLLNRALDQAHAGVGQPAYLAAVSHGIQLIFLVGAIICGVALIAAVFITEVPLRTTGGPGSKSEPTARAAAARPEEPAIP